MAKQRGRHRRPKENLAKEAVLRQGGRALAVSAIGLGVVTMSTQTAAAEDAPTQASASQEQAPQTDSFWGLSQVEEASKAGGLEQLEQDTVSKQYVEGEVIAENYYDAEADQWVQSKEVGKEQWLDANGNVLFEVPQQQTNTFDQGAAIREDCESRAADCYVSEEERIAVENGPSQQISRPAFNCTTSDQTQSVGWMVQKGNSRTVGGGIKAEWKPLGDALTIGGDANTSRTWSDSMTDTGTTNVVLKPGETGWVGVSAPQERVKGTLWTDYASAGSDPWYTNGLDWSYEDEWTRPVVEGTDGVYTALTAETRPMTEQETSDVCGN
ncbi:hypothetical protein ACWHLZ_41955 [Streptomyces chartreusis]